VKVICDDRRLQALGEIHYLLQWPRFEVPGVIARINGKQVQSLCCPRNGKQK